MNPQRATLTYSAMIYKVPKIAWNFNDEIKKKSPKNIT